MPPTTLPTIYPIPTKQTPTRPLHSSSKLTLMVTLSNTLSYGECAFSCFSPVQYILLPESLKQFPTRTAFKSGLKTHLFQSAYYQLFPAEFYPTSFVRAYCSGPWHIHEGHGNTGITGCPGETLALTDDPSPAGWTS